MSGHLSGSTCMQRGVTTAGAYSLALARLRGADLAAAAAGAPAPAQRHALPGNRGRRRQAPPLARLIVVMSLSRRISWELRRSATTGRGR